MIEDVVILSGVRTANCTFGGSLKDLAPADLGGIVIAEAVSRAGIAPDDVEHVVLGQVMPSTPWDAYLARVAAVNAGIPVSTPAMTLDRLCGSGIQAIISVAQMSMLGESDIAIAGGAEVMSKAPQHVTQARVGATGAIITVKLLHEPERAGGRYGLATMCIGGGQGIALIDERL